MGRMHNKVTSLCRRNISQLILRNTYVNLSSLIAVKVLDSASPQTIPRTIYKYPRILAAVKLTTLLHVNQGLPRL